MPFKVIQGHRFWYQSKAHMRLPISDNLLPILHRFRDIAFEVQNRYIWLPLLCLTPPAEGFPGVDLRKIFSECQWLAKVCIKCRRNIAENLNRLSRAHERYRRQTDGR